MSQRFESVRAPDATEPQQNATNHARTSSTTSLFGAMPRQLATAAALGTTSSALSVAPPSPVLRVEESLSATKMDSSASDLTCAQIPSCQE